jgi:hypothetical protein
MNKHNLLEAIRIYFPEDSPPRNILSLDATSRDFANEINNHFLGKLWTSVDGWRNMDLSIKVIWLYLNTGAYIYYLPSLMSSALHENYFDDAIDALLPQNQNRTPRGDKWGAYVSMLSQNQRQTIIHFLTYVAQTEPDNSAAKVLAEKGLMDQIYEG